MIKIIARTEILNHVFAESTYYADGSLPIGQALDEAREKFKKEHNNRDANIFKFYLERW